MKKINLSVIILSFNTKQLLKKCLESVIKEIRGPDKVEVIVVDNGSSDGSSKLIKSISSKAQRENLGFKFIENEKNLGFSGGNNLASRLAGGELLLFLNSDTIVKPKAIKKLIDFFKSNPEAGAASPILLNEDLSVQKDPCLLRFPFPIFTLVYYHKFLRTLANKFFPKIIYSTGNFKTPGEIDQLSGAALMIRKEIFEEIGGFDEDYQHFFEDVDLSYRLRKAGRQLFLVPEAEIIHLKGRSLESKVQKEGIEIFYYLNFKSLFLFCEKNYPKMKTFLIKTIVFANLATRFRIGLIKKLFFSQ